MAASREETGACPRRSWRGTRRRRRAPGAGAQTSPSLGDALRALLMAMGGTPERAGLQNLWDNWEAALGPELAAMAQPLGHHAGRGGEGKSPAKGESEGAVLLLGAEDAMLLQELRFRGGEILERVNGFLGHAYFREVKVSLPLGRRAPERSRAKEKMARRDSGARLPGAASGIFLAGMDKTSPVARCYARFVRRQEASPGMKAEHEERKENS